MDTVADDISVICEKQKNAAPFPRFALRLVPASESCVLQGTQPGRPDREEPEGIYVGVWSIHDNGDISPRWKLFGPKSTLKKPRGVVLDPKHKEMIIADMRLNSILTYYFPEIF